MVSHDCRDKNVQESKTRKRREERVKKTTTADDDEDKWETVTRPGKQLTIQVSVGGVMFGFTESQPFVFMY